MKYSIGVFVFAGLIASGAARAGDQILTFAGLQPVQIGMSVPDAEKALGYKLKPMDSGDRVSTDACWLTERADGTQKWLTYMVRSGKITRIDIWEGESRAEAVESKDGLHIGSGEAAVMKTLGTSLQISEHPHLGAEGRYLVLPAPDGLHGLLFEIAQGKVVNLRGGELESILLKETCA